MTIDGELAKLEEGIVSGEAWLTDEKNFGHERYAEYEKWYWRRVARWCELDLIRHDTIVTLALPPNTGWQRDEKSVMYRTGKVRFYAEPQAPDEMTREDLHALCETMKLKEEVFGN